MTELNVNHNVYQALHNAVQPAQEPGQRAAIEADEVQAIETAIIADGDVSTDESTLIQPPPGFWCQRTQW